MDDDAKRVRKKILLMGLDNGGKSSIVLSLKGDRNLMSYYSLKPTQGVVYDEIADLDCVYYIWDLGGQPQYRSRYLENLATYTDGVTKILYVIDVQDTNRYEEALDFLREILERMGERIKTTQLVFYLHKFDPRLELDLGNPINAAIGGLISKIKAITRDPNAIIFKTSIYTLFRKIAV